MMQRVLFVTLFFISTIALAEDTVLKLYRPFGDVTEQAPVLVKSNLKGHCFAQSQLILREDAWRCQAEGKVYDPCFAKETGKNKEVVCPQSPWIGDSVRIVVNEQLSNVFHKPLDMSRTYPWAIELINGEQCLAVNSGEVFDSMPIRYNCSDKHVLIGYLQRCNPVWSMLEKTPKGVVSVNFRKAWF
jgi:hypothetical protein